jgi:hypothetical protein
MDDVVGTPANNPAPQAPQGESVELYAAPQRGKKF